MMKKLVKRIALSAGIIILLLSIITCSGVFNPTEIVMTDGLEKRIYSEGYEPDGIWHEYGRLGRGAFYKIFKPPGWELQQEKKLLIYAHGYAPPGAEIILPVEIDDFRLLLNAQGFAVAYSSFSENGWAVKDGTIRTRQLLDYFKDSYGEPDKTYLVGASEGGIIALKLAEQNPELFTGVLSVCSLVGGAQLQMEYVFHVRVLFDYFFGDALNSLPQVPKVNGLINALGEGATDVNPDLLGPVPADSVGFITAVGQIMSIVLTDPANQAAAISMASVSVDGKPLFPWEIDPLNPTEFLPFLPEFAATLGITLWYNIIGTEDLLIRTHGHIMVDNSSADYTYLTQNPADIIALNTDIERLSSTPDAANYLKHWYQPKGKLEIPVVTLHTTRDPAVPFFHEYAYRDIVDEDYPSMLHQFQVEGFGHCALLDLVGGPPILPPFESYLVAAFNYLLDQTEVGPIWAPFPIPDLQTIP
jgi:pimeloyl-ACP methyl ester carboxylesterase